MSQGSRILVLKILALLQIVFGLLLVLSTYPPLHEIADALAAMAGRPDAVVGGIAFQLNSVAGGAFMAAFGIVVWYLVTTGMDQAPELSRKTILVGMVAWVVVDSLGNILIGAYMNLISHLVIMAIWVWALRPASLATA